MPNAGYELDGNDVSSYQPDWSPKTGQEFMGVKVSEGTSYLNPYKDEQESKGRKAGLVILKYHFLHHSNIDAQVAYFASNANIQSGDVLVCDWEGKGCTTADKDDFIKKLQERFPKNRVGLYCNTGWWLNTDTTSFFGDFLWVAWYSNSLSVKPPIKTQWLFWQWSQTPLDKNVCAFRSLSELKTWANSKGNLSAVVINTSAKVWFRGGWTCGCVATSLPFVEADMIKQGIIKESIDIYQLGYRTDVSASAGTHAAGGNTDVAQWSPEALKVWWKWGWNTQHRTKEQGFDDHGHGAPVGCTHLSPAGNDQMTDWRRGRNGLRQHEKVANWPGWINWKDALRQHAGSVKPTGEKEDEMTRTRVASTRTINQKVKKVNTYQTLWTTNSTKTKPASCSVLFGPGSVDFTVNITASGMTAKDKLWVRCYTVDYVNGRAVRNKGSETCAVEIDCNGGWTRKQATFSCVVGGPSKGHTSRRLRLEWSCTNKNAEIEECWIQGWSEK